VSAPFHPVCNGINIIQVDGEQQRGEGASLFDISNPHEDSKVGVYVEAIASRKVFFKTCLVQLRYIFCCNNVLITDESLHDRDSSVSSQFHLKIMDRSFILTRPLV